VRLDDLLHARAIARADDRMAVHEQGRRSVDAERHRRGALGEHGVAVAPIVERGAQPWQVDAGGLGELLEARAREPPGLPGRSEHQVVECPELALLRRRDAGLGGERRLGVPGHREVAVHDPHVGAVPPAHVIEDRRHLRAVRALEVAPHDDRHERVVGPELVPGQAEPDLVDLVGVEPERLAIDLRDVRGRPAGRDERFVADALLRRARELLIDDVDERLQRLAPGQRAAVDEERRRAGEAERHGVLRVGLDLRAVAAGVEIGAKADHVEPELARVQLEAGAIDAPGGGVDPVVHREEPALRRRGERRLGRDGGVAIERQPAVHEPDLSGVQPLQRPERVLRAKAEAARVIAPRHDRDRRVGGPLDVRGTARHAVDRGRIERQLVGASRRRRGQDPGEREESRFAHRSHGAPPRPTGTARRVPTPSLRFAH
jgi:hypothetical protein